MKDLNNHSIAYKRILYIKKQMENEDLKKILNRFTFLCRFASSFMAVLLYAQTTQSLFAQECKKGSIVNLQRSHQNYIENHKYGGYEADIYQFESKLWKLDEVPQS